MNRRILFLHGMWCPPDAYPRHFNSELLKQLDDANFDVVFFKSPRPNSSPVPEWGKALMPTIADDDHPEWYNANENEDGTKTLDGLELTIQVVREFVEAEEKPFDAVMGHSQGGQLSAIVTLLAESVPGWVAKDKMWKLVVPMNAPNPFDAVSNAIGGGTTTLSDRVRAHGTIRTPSLHIFGGASDMTLEGAKKMKATHFGDGAKVVTHDEGHFGPKDPDKCGQIVSLITSMLEKTS